MKKVFMKDGEYKYVKEGFSWTTYFFSGIPSIFRSDYKSACKLFLFGFLTISFYNNIKAFSINEDYENFLIEKGYEEVGYINEGFKENIILEVALVMIKIGVTVYCVGYFLLIVIILLLLFLYS